MSRRFRWTRERYRKADHLARLAAHLNLHEPPQILRRYWDLWAQHPRFDDPLLTPMRYRPRYLDDDIPF